MLECLEYKMGVMANGCSRDGIIVYLLRSLLGEGELVQLIFQSRINYFYLRNIVYYQLQQSSLQQLFCFAHLNMSILFKTQQLIQQIDREFKMLKQAMSGLKRLKRNERVDQIDMIKLKNIRPIKNLINSLQYSINLNEQNMDREVLAKQKVKLVDFQKRIQTEIKNMDYDKNERLEQKYIYEEREKNTDRRNDRGQLIKQADQAQKQSEDKLKGALRMMYEMKGINDSVNVELQRQIEQLDSVYEQLQQAESNMNRAIKHIQYFARSVYTDKLLMGLLLLIVIAVIVIIVLSAIGKLPQASQETIQ